MNIQSSRSPTQVNGQCACGLIKFSVLVEHRVAQCRCEICRRTSGSTFQRWVNARRDSLRVYGLPAQWRSSERASRQFCAACGSSLFLFDDGKLPQVEVAVSSIDDQKLIDRIDETFARTSATNMSNRPDGMRTTVRHRTLGATRDLSRRSDLAELTCEMQNSRL
jgi:hypothetical protein